MRYMAIYHAKSGGFVKYFESDSLDRCLALAKACGAPDGSLVCLSELGDREGDEGAESGGPNPLERIREHLAEKVPSARQ